MPPLAAIAPRQRGIALRHAQGHQPVVGCVEMHLVGAGAIAVKRHQAGQIAARLGGIKQRLNRAIGAASPAQMAQIGAGMGGVALQNRVLRP